MNAPTLLVGLGGTGSKIVERVSKLVTSEQRNDIAFAVLDTDVNELRDIRRRNPFIKTIQASTKQTVGEYLCEDTHARDGWFPVNAVLNSKSLTEGAGQVRSISRLALETVIRAGKMEPLHEAIQSLYKVEQGKSEQALRVVIVSSLAGGTGSGMLLPVALYIRNYLATHFRQSANITRGFFILPEVFFEVIPGQGERNSLKANAYAALRELDAFLMKGDATLHPRYKDSVKLEFPGVSSTGYEEHDIRPYDFCFLFDAQNADGVKLNSFEQYLDHAANCIYAQSIGPMNKRSNSSEDNVIRKLAKERGRNRYAGAGASMLIYPFADIRSFVALKWAKECVSEQWLTFDNMYREICEENNIRREQGMAVQNPKSAEFYMTTIETQANQGNPFAKAIIKSCGRYSPDGVTKKADRWIEYVTELKRKVEEDTKTGQRDLDTQRANVNALLGDLGSDWDDYINAYYEAEKYRAMVAAYVEEASQTIAYSMFKAPKDGCVDENLTYQLENYLMSVDKDFLHPNAIRYLLNKTVDLMRKELLSADEANKKTKKYFDNFVHNTFDNPDTEEEETPESLGDRKTSFAGKLKKGPSEEQEEIRSKLRTFVSKADEYRTKHTLAYVLQEGIRYIESIIKSFENFYKTFEGKVEVLDKSIDAIYKKYENRKGSTARYVCASRKCLDKLYSKKAYTGGTITIDSELARNIYFKVLNYATMKDKPSGSRYFSQLFDKDILGYFEKKVMDNYGNDIDIDVIAAIENEAIYEYGYDQEENANELIEEYVKKVIANTRELSCPFIESPLGEAREPINACTFNSELRVDSDSPKSNLISSELLNFGGVPDEDVPKNMIMFYQSFYGLRANDLGKFAPPEKTLTYNRSSGEYFKAYYDLIEGINPETNLSRDITPHIDRWWHIITKMPDLDEANQARQEHNIYAAFFWGLLGNYIDLYDEGNGEMIYKLHRDRLNMDSDRLVVSNGTDCDKLYEVLDAVAIYPELVNKILGKVNEIIEEELNEDISIEEGMLYTFLDSLLIKEPGIGKENLPANSIFDIPMLMKKSSTIEIYYEEEVIELLRAEIEEIKRYFSKFCTEKEMPGLVGGLLKEQFEKYMEDMALEREVHPNLYKESLFDRTCSIIIDAFEKLGLKSDAKAMYKRVIELRR